MVQIIEGTTNNYTDLSLHSASANGNIGKFFFILLCLLLFLWYFFFLSTACLSDWEGVSGWSGNVILRFGVLLNFIGFNESW